MQGDKEIVLYQEKSNRIDPMVRDYGSYDSHSARVPTCFHRDHCPVYPPEGNPPLQLR
jgi:hypothetical protein